VACLETIRAGARRCPHCHAPQGAQRWQVIGDSLKWIGGVTAVLSLFLVAQQVNNVVQSWTDRQESVAALIKASGLQANAGDYAGAWGLLEEALELEPGSTRVQAQRVDLAMLWVRNVSTFNDQTFSEIINPLLPSLYLGAVRSGPGERADALAHIGWSNALRALDGARWLAIDGQFDAALETDPNNVFAHAWQARWLYMRPNTRVYEADRIDLARSHFDAALATGQQRAWIRSLQLSSYLGSHYPAARVEAIAVVASIEAEGGTLSAGQAGSFKRTIRELLIERGDQADALRELALNSFSWTEILAVYGWVGSTHPDGSERPLERYVLARLTELSGDPAAALAMYRSLRKEAGSGYTFSDELLEAVERLDGAAGN
jgi:tetratricopeptide (TPR) repeat protein